MYLAEIISKGPSSEVASKLETWLDGPSFLFESKLPSGGAAPYATFEPNAEFHPVRRKF